jgi:hypothetical protein
MQHVDQSFAANTSRHSSGKVPETLADHAEQYRACPEGIVDDLTEAQKRSLHLFKHTMSARLNFLYKRVPADQADEIVAPLLRRLASMASSSSMTLADHADQHLGCAEKTVEDFTEAQKRSLHAFKHALTGKLRLLYKKVPAERADKLVAPLLQQLADKI